jgi:anaerobic selenocysteine-containing dehydrogenase
MSFALGKVLRAGLGAHSAVLPETISPALDAYRAPLSTIADAKLVVVLGDDPVVERAPIVDLWLRAARRAGAQVVTTRIGARQGGVPDVKDDELGKRLREEERAVLIWSGPRGAGGEVVAGLAEELGLGERDGCAAFYLPQTANGRGVADAWAAAAEGEEANPEPIGLLIASGDEAVANPDVRALGQQAEAVLAISMFRRPLTGWADLVLPGTSYLERDGTYVNLEGRLQRLRRAVIPPGPDELAWIAKLAERIGVDVSPHAPQVFAELSAIAYDGLEYGRVGELAPLPPRVEPPVGRPSRPQARQPAGKGLRLVTYRPLFSGPAVERVPELQFQRPEAEIELSAEDARRLKVEPGRTVRVSSNGTSVELRARINRELVKGAARVPADYALGLGTHVQVTP